MANVKLAISIRESLFKQAEALARELKVSRSQVFGMAIEKFLREFENRQLLEKINQAYASTPTAEEEAHQTQMKAYHRRLVEDNA